MRKVAILGCTKRKNTSRCPAVELYQASLFFRKELRYAREVLKADDIFILSAKHHLIHSSKVIAPYDVTLVGMRKSERMQ